MVFGWLLAFLLFLGIELVTVNLVSIWFAIGAFVSMILAYFTDNFYIQMQHNKVLRQLLQMENSIKIRPL